MTKVIVVAENITIIMAYAIFFCFAPFNCNKWKGQLTAHPVFHKTGLIASCKSPLPENRQSGLHQSPPYNQSRMKEGKSFPAGSGTPEMTKRCRKELCCPALNVRLRNSFRRGLVWNRIASGIINTIFPFAIHVSPHTTHVKWKQNKSPHVLILYRLNRNVSCLFVTQSKEIRGETSRN